jgi:PAS domain S-box-containing protein
MSTAEDAVLVVGDIEFRRRLSDRLRSERFAISTARTGAEALRLARVRHPSLILSALELSDMTGPEICWVIKSDPRLQGVFISLVSSSDGSEADRLRCLESGADDFIVCSDGGPELPTRLRTLLRLRETAVALRAREEQYKQLIESLPGAVALIDHRGRFLRVNSQLVALLGYDTATELLSKNAFCQIQCNGRTLAPESLGASFRAGAVQNLGCTITRRDGSQIPIDVHATLMEDVLGYGQAIIAVIRDISDQQRVEKQRAAFSNLAHRLGAAATVEDAARIILEVASELFGHDAGYVDLYSASEDKLIPILTLDTIEGQVRSVPPKDLSADPSPFMRLVMTKGAQLVNRHGGDASVLPVALVPFGDKSRPSASMMYAPIRSAGVTIGLLSIQSYRPEAYSPEDLSLLGALGDHCGDALERIRIAERRREAEAALERSLLLQKAILDNIADPAWLKDAEGRYLACNAALARMFDCRVEDVLGKTVSEISPADARVSQQEDAQVLSTGKPVLFQKQPLEKHGRVRWYDRYRSPLFDPKGNLVGSVGIARDVTSHKYLEEELRQLPRRIIGAQESERLRVARELHDSVNQLLATAQLRLSKVQESAPEFRPSTREILRRCHDLLIQAIEENRRIAHDLRPSDLDELGFTIACHNFCRQFTARTGLRVRCRVTRFAQRLPPDMELNLFRIVQEALHNAARHAGAKLARLRVTLEKGALRLVVSDDGRGFKPGATRRKRNRSGGLGLTNISERAGHLGGSCEVQSAPGQGTTLIVRVPVDQPNPDARRTPEKRQA